MANVVLYGFLDLQSVFAQRVTDDMIPVVNAAVDRSIAEHNRQMNALINLFVTRTTRFQERYTTPGNETLQPGDENGRYLPTKGGGSYDVAYPLQFAGTAWGANRTARLKMTVEEVNNQLAAKMNADKRWVRNHILAALLADATWTFTDKEHGALTIQPLANGDGTLFSMLSGSDAGADDSHLLGQAGAIANDANPYPTIYDELMEHPENGGEVIAFIPNGLRATTEALTNFKEAIDPDITPGLSSDRLTGSLGVPVPGVVLGKVDRVWVVEWKVLPASRIVAVTTDGERPVAMREQPEPELQGFQRIGTRSDVPYSEDQYERQAGFGIRNRVGAVVMEIGDASYDTPTGWASPLI